MRLVQIYVCSCSSNPDYMAPALTWQIEMVLSRDPRPAPTAHQCCLRLQCQHSGLCAVQWGQLFPLTPRAHVTKAHREWERDRHPDICLCRLRDMQTDKHCRATGSLHKSKPTRRDARVWLTVHDFTHNFKIVTLLTLRAMGGYFAAIKWGNGVKVRCWEGSKIKSHRKFTTHSNKTGQEKKRNKQKFAPFLEKLIIFSEKGDKKGKKTPQNFNQLAFFLH